MADNVIKLRVDSQEYESKIQRASKGLQALGQSLHDAGKTFADADAKAVEFASELGKMQTVSNTAKGKIGEMSTAFVNLKTMYLQMTDAEKQSPLGQAMSKSLDELKTRTINAKQELADINKELNDTGKESTETGGFLGQLSDKFTLNIDAIKLFNMGLTATKAALDVAKDAFFASETNVDDWGRTVAATEGIYDSFLQTLNNGDFSGFLSRIGEVISKAHDAYNALDELNTRMTIINPERTRLQARATELKAIIRRQGAGSEAGVAAQAELKQIEGMLSQAFKTESQLNMNAFKAKVDQKLADAGIKLGKKDYDFLMRTFSSDASFMAMKRGAKGSRGSDYVAGGSYDEGSTYKYDTRNMNQKLLDLFTDEWRQQNSPLLNAAFSAKGAASSMMLGNSRYLKEGGGGSGAGGGRTDKVVEDSIDEILAKQWETASRKMATMADSLRGEDTGPSDVWKLITTNADEATDSITSLAKAFGELNKAEGLPENGTGQPDDVVKNTKSMSKEMEKFVGISNGMLGGINDIVGGLQGLGIEIPKELQGVIGGIQSLMSIVTGIAAILSIIQTLQAIQTTESTIKSIPVVGWLLSQGGVVHAASGYEVPGNYYSGDQVPALLNSGELVLNKAQQGNLASQLQGNGLQNIKVAGRIKGTDIILSIDRSLKLEGKELLTWGH